MTTRAQYDRDMKEINSLILKQLEAFGSKFAAEFQCLNAKVEAGYQEMAVIKEMLMEIRSDQARLAEASMHCNAAAGTTRTTESPGTSQCEMREEKPNIIRAAPVESATPLSSPVPPADLPGPPAPAAPATTEPTVPTGAPTAEPGPSSPEESPEQEKTTHANATSQDNGNQIPQELSTDVPPPQTLTQALEQAEFVHFSDGVPIPSEEEFQKMVADIRRQKPVRKNFEQVLVYSVFYAVYSKVFGMNEEPLQYLPTLQGRDNHKILDGNMNATMSSNQFKLKSIINLLQTMPEYKLKPALIARNLKVNTTKNIDKIRKRMAGQNNADRMRSDYERASSPHPETPAGAPLFETMKRSNSISSINGVEPSSGGSGGAPGEDGAEIDNPEEDDTEELMVIFATHADPSLPETQKAIAMIAEKWTKIKSEPDDSSYERPVVIPKPSSSGKSVAASSSAAPVAKKTSERESGSEPSGGEAPAPKAASTGGKKKITANEKEILSRTLPQTKTAPEPETNRKESPKKKKAPVVPSPAVTNPTTNHRPAVPYGTRSVTVTAPTTRPAVPGQQPPSATVVQGGQAQQNNVGRPIPPLMPPPFPGRPMQMNYVMMPGYMHPVQQLPRQAGYSNQYVMQPQSPQFIITNTDQWHQKPTKRPMDFQQNMRGPPNNKYGRFN